MTESRPYKLIVFDWDGTLMDSVARIVSCFQAAAADLEIEPLTVDAIRHVIGIGMREAVAELLPNGDSEQHEALISRYRYHDSGGNATPSGLFGGVLELLQGLEEDGYYLGVATSKGRRGLDRVLDATATRRFFHATRTADEAFSKPHPQMLLDVMERVGVEPRDTLMVGDTEYDMHMAHNARAHALAVSYGAHDRKRLLECRPLDCLDSVSQLIEWFRQGNLPVVV